MHTDLKMQNNFFLIESNNFLKHTHNDPVEFIPTVQGFIHSKSISITHHTNKLKIKAYYLNKYRKTLNKTGQLFLIKKNSVNYE